MEEKTAGERIYLPVQNAGWGWAIWRELFLELYESRGLIWRLFLRDFSARYRQSILGILWALILPALGVGTFVLLNRSGVLQVGNVGVPYTVYALMGLTAWHVFGGGLPVCTGSILAGGSMVVKINFPKKALVISALGQVVFELLIRLGLLTVVMIVFRVAPSWTVVFVPMVLIPLFLFVLGLGLLLSLCNVVIRDTAGVVGVVTSFLMFLTPVVYPAGEGGLLAKISVYNPLAVLVTAFRDVALKGTLTDPAAFGWASGLSLILFLFSFRVFHIMEARIAERI